MITGWVDRGWAKHHYRRWYREHFEGHTVVPGLSEMLHRPARVRCATCATEQSYPSWDALIARSFKVEPVVCPSCQTPLRLMLGNDRRRAAETIIRHLKTKGVDEPLEEQGTGVAA